MGRARCCFLKAYSKARYISCSPGGHPHSNLHTITLVPTCSQVPNPYPGTGAHFVVVRARCVYSNTFSTCTSALVSCCGVVRPLLTRSGPQRARVVGLALLRHAIGCVQKRPTSCLGRDSRAGLGHARHHDQLDALGTLNTLGTLGILGTLDALDALGTLGWH